MDSSKKNSFISPAKIILNNKIQKFCHSTFNSESHLKLLQSFETPPAKFIRTKNPFDSLIDEKLDTHIASPSTFAKTVSPKSEESFRWDIDMLASLKPAHIDHHTTDQFETPERNPDIESFAQSRINKFFSLQEIVPSPYTVNNVIELPIPSEELISPEKPVLCNNSAQTILSLPPILPKNVEEVLKPFFTQTKSQEDGANSFLYRNLFESESINCSDSTSPAKSIDFALSPIQYSPNHNGGEVPNRTSNSPTDDLLKTCELSPVIIESRLRTKLKYASQMSIDCSFNVPDEEDETANDMSIGSGNSKNSIDEKLSDSTVHWDLEFKKICSPNSEHNNMEESHLNTPKLRAKNSQRKKLSDSFPNLDEEDENEVVPSITSDFSDAGYHTGCITTEESSTWSTTNLFASTPTKQKVIRNSAPV